jgi:hypothetical protein
MEHLGGCEESPEKPAWFPSRPLASYAAALTAPVIVGLYPRNKGVKAHNDVTGREGARDAGTMSQPGPV